MDIKCYHCNEELDEKKLDESSKNALNSFFKKYENTMSNDLEKSLKSVFEKIFIEVKEQKKEEFSSFVENKNIKIKELVKIKIQELKNDDAEYIDLLKKIKVYEDRMNFLLKAIESNKDLITLITNMEEGIIKPIKGLIEKFEKIIIKKLKNYDFANFSNSANKEFVDSTLDDLKGYPLVWKCLIKNNYSTGRIVEESLYDLINFIYEKYTEFWKKKREDEVSKLKSLEEALIVEEEELKNKEAKLIEQIEEIKKEKEFLEKKLDLLTTT